MKYAIMYARNLADSENVVHVEEPSLSAEPVIEPVVTPVVELVMEPIVTPVVEPVVSTELVLEPPPDDEIPPETETVSPTFTLDSVYPPDEDEFN